LKKPRLTLCGESATIAGVEEDVRQAADSFVAAVPPFESSVLPAPAPIEWYQPPRLGIIHLLAWVTLGVVFLKAFQSLEMLDNPLVHESDRAIALAHQLRNYCNAMLGAGLVIGGVLLATDLFRRKRGIFQPGHWFVALNCCVFLFGLGVNSAMLLFVSDRSAQTPFLLLNAVVYAVVALTYCQMVYCFSKQRRWQLAAAFLASLECLKGAFLASIAFAPPWSLNAFLVSQWVRVPAVLVVLLVMGIDVVRGFRRDWLHWLGAVSIVCDLALDIAWFVTTEYLANGLK
jgi:hypothetical protein